MEQPCKENDLQIMAFPHLCRFTGGYGKTQNFSANCQHGSPQEARESLKRDVQQVPVSCALWIRVDLGSSWVNTRGIQTWNRKNHSI